jgi:hypothetical protein
VETQADKVIRVKVEVVVMLEILDNMVVQAVAVAVPLETLQKS